MNQPRYSKRIKRLLRHYAGVAYERELAIFLERLEGDFAAWRQGTFDAVELEHRIHRFHQGPARELFKRYIDNPYQELTVAYAIVTGLISRDEVPTELLDTLRGPLAMHERMMAEGELRMPGEIPPRTG